MTRRIALYARRSSSDDNTSIQKQLAAGQREAERITGFTPAAYVTKTYVDEGVSGATRLVDRPEGHRMIQDARRGKFDTVVFYSLDRFTRSTMKGLADFEYMEDELELTLIFAKENIDTSTPSGKLFRTMLAAFSEFERDTIRDRHMAGRHLAATNGKGWGTGAPPYGYRLDEGGNLEVREDEAEIVHVMFEMRSIGITFRNIANTLNERNISPRERISASTGKPILQSFSAGSVHAYINGTYYKGEPIVRRISPAFGADPEVFEYPAPAIISKHVWALAQRRNDLLPERA
jgi:site-specific DNA recombinase